MWDIKTVFIVFLFLFSSLYFPAGSDEFNDNSTTQEIIIDENHLDETERTQKPITQPETREQSFSPHGGSWVDSFEDNSGMDWGKSDHLKVQTGDVTINITPSIDPDIIAQWHFDEGTGTAFYDSTPNNLDGTIYGATWVTGMYDKALSFDGINDHATVLHNTKLVMGTNAFTASAWIKIDSSETSYQYVLSKGDTGGIGNPSNDYHLGLEGNNGYAMFSVSDASKNSYSVYGNMDLRDDQWHFVVGTRNGNTVKVYVDGSLKDTLTNSNIASCNVGGNGPFAFSYAVDHNPNFDLHGLVDEVTLYSTALTDTQITNKYENKTYSRIRYGNMTSNVINLPAEMYWDTLLIDKTQTANNYLNVTILDASNDQPIPGAPVYITADEFDISFIDPVQYPSIKLNATFEGDGSTTPILHFWGISWNASNEWRDTFFGGQKVENSDAIEGKDDDASLKLGSYGYNAVVLWHFNEAAGTTVIDETANKNNGTIYGASRTAGKYGDGLSFDGVDDYVDVPNSNSLTITGNKMSIEAWVKIKSYANTETQLICKGKDDNWIWGISVMNTGRIRLLMYNGNNDFFDSNAVLSQDTWFHVVVRYDGTQKTIFINAKNEGQRTSSGNIIERGTDKSILIGDRNGSSNDLFFDGILDDVAVYDRSLSGQEITDHYMNTKNRYPLSGNLISKPISIPDDMFWDTLLINKTEPANTDIKITILDENPIQPIQSYENLDGTSVDISGLDPLLHNSIKLEAVFRSDTLSSSTIHDWSVNWTMNNAPNVVDVTGPPQVYRNNSILITANLTDKEDSESRLTLDVKYQSPKYVSWQTIYLSTPIYVTDHWEINFTPSKDAITGDYTFMISCKDSFDSEYIYPDPFIIEVLNNIPSQPEVEISPEAPVTLNDLEVNIIQAEDVETPEDQLDFWYRWYRDDVLISEIENFSKVSSSHTAKGQEWRCEALSYDGEDTGPAGQAVAIIQNSAPVLIGSFDNIILEEDMPLEYDNELSFIFSDPDSDELTYTAEGQVNLNIEIVQETGLVTLTPDENWNGRESITFTANDTEADADTIVEIIVFPVNDLPVIKQVGSQLVSGDSIELEFIVNQDDWINLTVISEDVDGDDRRGTLYYILNITERSNLFFDNDEDKLVFNPKNADVGWHYIEIKVTDNNETPAEYTSQKIKIQVLNVNDPPSVQIIEPEDGIKITQKNKLTFVCNADDIDLLIPDSTEKLTYRWYARTPEVIELGTGKELVNPKLPVGQISITVEVKDADNAVATDSILVNVAKAESGATPLTSSVFFWLVMIMIIIIIVILVIYFLFARKKRRKADVVHPEVVAPGGEPSPYTGAPMGPAPVYTGVAAAVPQAAVRQEVRLELPQTTSPVPTYSLTEEPQAGATAEPTPQEKLKTLEDRLISGEISEDIYRDLKSKIEMEMPLSQPQPTPQLPAAQVMPVTSAPTPEEPVQPEPESQEVQSVVPQLSQDAYPVHLELPVQEAVVTQQVAAPAVPEQIPQEQASQPPQQALCTTCGQPMAFVEQYNNYYCYQCQKYA